MANKRQAEGVIRTLDNILAVFGPNGRNWTKGAFHVKKWDKTEKVLTKCEYGNKASKSGHFHGYEERPVKGAKKIDAYCLLGAAKKVDGIYEERTISAIEQTLRKTRPDDDIMYFNDSPLRQFADVKALIQRTKALVKAGKITI